jgi:hypothetical protein
MKGQDMRHHNDPSVLAGRMGLVAVSAAEDELQLDIDNPLDHEVADRMLAVLEAHDIPCEVVRATPSKSGNFHITMRIEWPRPLDPVTRIALQACFGSDRKRELLSLLRHEFKTQNPPTVFFEVAS